MISDRIAEAEKFCAELHHLTTEATMPDTQRNRAAGASFGIALDHHAAIVLLVKNRMYSSGFALLRLVFEAYVRGLWLKHCATDEQLDKHMLGAEPPQTMIADIEKAGGFSRDVLSGWKKKNYGVMCDFTHTGGLHLQRWQTDCAVEPNFELYEITECLNSAEVIGVLAALELSQLREDSNTVAEIINLSKSRWPLEAS